MYIKKNVYKFLYILGDVFFPIQYLFAKELVQKNRKYRVRKDKGFTILELLVTVGVIAIIISFALRSDLDIANAQKEFVNTSDNLQGELSSLRNEAMMRNTTTRMVITETSGIYTIDTYYADTPTTICTEAGGTWTSLVSAKPLNVNGRYQLTGSPMSNTCFYRDGSSSGGALVLAPITTTTGLKTSTLTITIATGYVDVDIQ